MASPALYLVGRDDPPPSPRPTRVRGMATQITLRTELQGFGLDAKSVDTYYRRIIKADAWCTARGSSLAKAPGPLIARYADTLPRSWATRKELRAACKWYWMITKRRDPPLSFIRVPPKPTMVCKAVEESDAVILAELADTAPWPSGHALTLGLYQALRREEIATLPWSSFGRRLRVVGKGEKERNISVHPEVTAKFAGVEQVGQYVFPGRFGGHVSPATVWSWIRKLGDEVGLHVTPHMLRHTCLATQHDNTGNLLAVMKFAGHSRPETTSGYTRTTDQAMHAVMMSVDYLGKRSGRRRPPPTWPSLFDGDDG